MAQGRDRIVKYKKIEGAKVGYRLFNVEDKSIGYVREEEFTKISEMIENKSMAVLYLTNTKEDNSPNVEKEMAEFIIANKNDTVKLIEFVE